jgi:hypothetical protein
MFTMGSLFPPLTSAGEWGRHTMRIFGHLGIAFVMFWLLPPALMAITLAETAVQVPDATQSPLQPTPSIEDDLLNTLD